MVTIALTLSIMGLGAGEASAIAPTVSNTRISSPATDPLTATSSVTLEADINPEKKASFFHFEYGFADCASNPCASAPVPEEGIGSGSVPVTVKVQVDGLEPGTVYHFRAVAHNNSGETIGPDTTFFTYPLPPVFGPCPNDPFRSGLASAMLPDCRAYEQASPTDKNGASVEGIRYVVQAGADGRAVSFYQAGGIPGGVGAQSPPVYVASRGVGAWTTTGLLPPPSLATTTELLGWAPDFSHVYSEAGIGKNIALLRGAPGEAPEKVVDYAANANYAFVYETPDGTRAFFEAEGTEPAPGAAPGRDNLYLWDAEAHETRLVGALPGGAAPPGGAFAGPYDFIQGNTGRGGALAGYYTVGPRPVSEDGERAYFTAGGGQLYLREDATTPGASTEHVSASHRTPPDPLGARPAIFTGASADGAAAFFISPEKLTDDAKTGPEPAAPQIGRAKLADPSDKQEDFIPTTTASGIAVFGGHIYWANSAAGTIGRAKLNGSEPVSEVDPSFISGAEVGAPQYVAVDSEHIYWTNAGDGADGNGTIGRAEIGGGDPLKNFITGASNPQGIAVNGSKIYWANAGEANPTREIGCAEISGSEADQQCIQLATLNDSPQGVALDENHVYWGVEEFISATTTFDYVKRADLDGSNEKLVFLGENLHIRGIALDGSHVYWAEQGSGQTGRANLELGEVQRPFATAQGALKGVALDGEHIYWSANGEATPNPGSDLYRYEVGGTLKDLTPDSDPDDENGAEVKAVLGVSEDGSRAYFLANAALSATPNSAGESAAPGSCTGRLGVPDHGVCNLYLWEAGETEFVARLNADTDTLDWEPSELSGSNVRKARTSRMTADGGALLFLSTRRLTPYDNEGVPEAYRYDASDGSLLCVSCNPTGAPPQSPVTLQSITGGLSPAGSNRALNRNLSADGNRVLFETPDKLVGADVNGEGDCPPVGSFARRCQDVYEWEAAGSGSCASAAQNGGCLYLVSTGASPDPSYLADASASGDDVFIFTSEQLVGQDRDELVDIYDARAGGGLASQNEVAPVPCEGEGCKPKATDPPPGQSAGSATFSGPGDPALKRPTRCAKGKRRVRHRCVRKRRPAHHRDRRPSR